MNEVARYSDGSGIPTGLKTLPRKVAVLCCARKSVYKTIPDCDCFDEYRDARTFTGGMPVVAHAPCRLWSAYCAHQAKPDDREAEMALGVWCVGQVIEHGGVLEQPAHSRLWDACQLPKPGSNGMYAGFSSESWAMELPQFWFGDSREKSTWLYFSRIPWDRLPSVPFRLKPEGGDRRIWQLMSSKNQRERTPPAFAQWLVECARRSAKLAIA